MNRKEMQHKLVLDGPEDYNYNGVPIFAAAGVHESVFDSFLKANLSKGSKILILGAGAGGFDARLIEAGYKNITATELNPENYLVKGTNLIEFDLNKDFSDLGKFDCIIALEIIEHLENQFQFMRSVKNCMEKDSIFYLSSPNVESTFSRSKFFTLGKLHFFSEEELYKTGHITPIFDHILRFNLESNNLKIEEHFTNRNVWSNAFIRFKKMILLYVIFFIMSLFTKKTNNFDISLYKIVSK